VLGGHVDFTGDDKVVDKDIIYTESHYEPRISAASSMVKKLTPLVLYLRYLAQPREILIIDEPEMNLYPTDVRGGVVNSLFRQYPLHPAAVRTSRWGMNAL